MITRATFVAALLLAAAPLRAELLTFQMTGHLIEAKPLDFEIGDKFTLTYSFDNSTPIIPIVGAPDIEVAYASAVSWQAVFERGYVFGATQVPNGQEVGEDELTNDNSYYVPRADRYIASFYTPGASFSSSGVPLPSGHTLNYIQIDIYDQTPTGNPDLLSSLDNLTSPPDISQVTDANGRLVFDGAGIPAQPHFVIDSLVAVPEPAGGVLGVVAFAALTAWCRISN